MTFLLGFLAGFVVCAVLCDVFVGAPYRVLKRDLAERSRMLAVTQDALLTEWKRPYEPLRIQLADPKPHPARDES